MDNPGKFYLGRLYDAEKGQLTQEPLLYDSDDLTTHAVVVGMTGSGKTGLCIGLLEEAALNGIPALMIDPKGDITNALLHFPELRPEDFKLWVNADEARRNGQTLDQAAFDAASSWRKGLTDWGIGPERLLALQQAADFAIYTPGSDAGLPVSILASLEAPPIPWEGNREVLREKISGTVTALLGLVGLNNIDPVRSREHILLSNIFEHAWSKGNDLDLGELIMQTQSPPFAKLGVFDINAFFPEKDRFELAMLLNNILAAPAFQAWVEGQPLDIQSLLFTEDGRPRHSVFYIAHLSEAERMFFVTLLYSAVESWMRAQGGVTTLRAILYFDEIFGYLPPLGNPPSKQLILRMLKQARAFGVGQVLVTQNPVDVDYKALSNAGTWMIGKLQTDQDKQRLLDGLQGVAGGMDRGQYDRLISGLGKRVFLLHNVHAKKPAVFGTRFAMNYLAGPLTRSQIPALNALVGARIQAAAPEEEASLGAWGEEAAAQARPAGRQQAAPRAASEPAAKAAGPTAAGTATRPALPAGISEFFLPNNMSLSEALSVAGRPYDPEAASQGLLYRPVLFGQASVRYFNRKFNLDSEQMRSVQVANPDRRGVVRWENFVTAAVNPRSLDDQPAPQARFAPLEPPFGDAKAIVALQKDFVDWVFRSSPITLRVNETLQVYAGPEVSSGEFRTLCSEAARAKEAAEVEKAAAAYDKKLATLQDKLRREERELDTDQSDLSQRKMEEMGTHAENVFGLFTGRKSSRRISSSLSKRRMTQKAKDDVEESLDAIAEMKKQIKALEEEKEQVLQKVQDRWSEIVGESREMSYAPLKKDVLLDLFGVAWMPYYLLKTSAGVQEIAGYGEAA